jgi:hypothetical protein
MSNRLVFVVSALAPCFTTTFCGAAAVVFPLSQGGNGHAYDVVFDDGTSFGEARAAAGGGGWHLLTITSAAEQSFVEQLLIGRNAPTGSYWIDLERDAGGGYAWGTGETFGYSNFAAGEPNDFLRREDAGQIYWSQDVADDIAERRGKWNDAPASGYPNADNMSFPTPDLARAGFIVEHDGAGRPGDGGGPVAIPIPAAALGAPLAGLVAGFAARRMRRRGAD